MKKATQVTQKSNPSKRRKVEKQKKWKFNSKMESIYHFESFAAAVDG